MLPAATYFATLQKVETWSTFRATHNRIFCCNTLRKEGVLLLQLCPQLVTQHSFITSYKQKKVAFSNSALRVEDRVSSECRAFTSASLWVALFTFS